MDTDEQLIDCYVESARLMRLFGHHVIANAYEDAARKLMAQSLRASLQRIAAVNERP